MWSRTQRMAILPLVGAFIILISVPSSAERLLTARVARTLNGSDTAHLYFLHLTHNGEWLLDEGEADGSLRGRMLAELDPRPPVFQGTFTIITRSGRISGHGSADAHGSGRYESFAGSLTVTSGTGAYARVHGRAGLYGTFDRRTYGLVIQTKGTLTY